jgi:LEA14-like dessication related protein
MKRLLLIWLGCFLCLSCEEFKEVQVTGVKSFRVTKLNMEGIEAEVIVGIKNPNTKGFSIYPSEFDATFSGIKLGKAKLYKRVHIGANCEKPYVFKIKSSFKELNFMELSNLLNSQKRGNIELNGSLKAGKFYIKKRVPVNIKEKIDLSGLGL